MLSRLPLADSNDSLLRIGEYSYHGPIGQTTNEAIDCTICGVQTCCAASEASAKSAALATKNLPIG